ncbi:MAG: iron-sulfur cluster assembly scaffold protein [Rhodospirillaceae bacterium]|nr:iron-sulfur cluster assembly scaffold protein [Rhodospirillaceae bacterium]
MSGADDIYDARIKTLAAQAETLGPVDHAACRHEADNFLCGDRMAVEVDLDGNRVKAVGGKVRGCLLTRAAAALLSQVAPGLERADLQGGIKQVEALMADGTPATGAWEGLNAFTPVHGAKHRHDCVLLPFQALAACLDQTGPRDG